MFFNSFGEAANRMISSAYSKIGTLRLSFTLIPLCFSFISMAKSLIKIPKRVGLKLSPCNTLRISNVV